MKQQIIALIRELGPIVPSEITNKLQSNSVIVSALISELIKEGQVLYSHKKFRTSPLYYIKGQEQQMRDRIRTELNIAENKIVEFFEKNKLMLKSNLSPQQRYMVDSLRDFITPLTLNINGENKIFYKHHSVSSQTIYDQINKKNKPKIETKKEEIPQQRLFSTPINKPEPKPLTPVKIKSPFPTHVEQKKPEPVKENQIYKIFDNRSDQFFTQYNMSVLKSEHVRKGKEANFIARANYRIPQTYFVKYLNKKTINENDISKAFAESQISKNPCLIVTTGKTSKKSENFLTSLGSIVKIIRI